MSEEKHQEEIKWYDKKLMIRSTLVGLTFFAIFWGLAKRAEPPEGYVFERLPTISGVYRCCEAGGRYSKSWVGSTIVFCLGSSYYQLSTGRDDCGHKEELDGRLVDVDQVFIPTIWGPSRTAVRLSTQGHNFYEVTDERLRQIWISGSQTNAFTLAFILAAIFHGAQLILIDRQTRKSKGNTK